MSGVFVVHGADGRRVGLFTDAELRDFKRNIGHAVEQGHNIDTRLGPPHGRRGETIDAETFTITPVRDGQPVTGEAEEWSA